MYKIFVNDLCIFDDTSSDLGLKVTDAKLSMEDNSAGSLEMTLPISNVGYGSIIKMRSHIVVYRNTTKIWGGRPVTETEDFYKNRTYHCEGELAYLNDTFQPLEEYSGLTLRQFLQVILHVHNNKCNGDEVFESYSNMPYQGRTKVDEERGIVVCDRMSTFDYYDSTDEAPPNPDPEINDGRGEASIVTGHLDKRIYLGTVTMHDDANNDYRYTNYQSTMDVLAGLLERLGGHIRIRTGGNGYLLLDYLRDYPSTNVRQTVELAKNLLDYAKDYDMSNLCTVLLPLGAKKSGEDIVGDEKRTHWNRKSYMDSVGRIRYGKYFHRTKKLECEKKSNWLEYDSISGKTVEKEVENTLTFNGEQVAGEVYVAFYNKLGNFISAATASATDQNPKDKGTQCFVNFNITIPEEAASVSFGYYYGGSINTREFRAIFESNYKTWIYTNSTLDKEGKSVCVANEKIDNYGQFVAPVDESYVVSNKIRVKEKESYFITSRQNNGYGMYCCYNDKDEPINPPQTATTGVGYTDWEKYKVETPVGAHYIIVGAKTGVSLNPVVYGNGKTTSDYETTPDEYITIKDVNGGDVYLRNQALIDEYGWIEKQAVWEDIESPADLLARANEYLQYAQYGDMTLEVTAYDLSLNKHNNASAIRLLDMVRVVSAPHNLDISLPVTKLEIPLLDPVNATYSLGTDTGSASLTSNSAASDLEIFKRLSEVPKPSNILSSARANATEILNMESEGYISNDGNEFLIMDYPDKEHCTKLWRWNINGLGYSSTGYAGTYGTAITMDGSIVADRITTGYMHADRIRGGTLTLGGYDGVNGEFYMKNGNGDNFVKMTKDGAEMIVKISQPARWLWTTSSQITKRNYGIVEYDKGCITGYTARIKAELEENPSPNWFNTYSFSFDDVSDKSAITRFNMVANEDRAAVESIGTRLHSNKFFIASCSTPDSVWSYNTPRLELHQNNSGSLVFGVVSSGFVGMRYNTNDSAITSEDASTYVNPLTLTIRNDSYPSSVSAGIGVGGVSLVSKRGPISLEGNTIYAKGNDISISKGTTPLTNLSGSFPIIFTIRDTGSGYEWTTGEITIVNGFVTEVSGLTPSGSGGSGDSGGGFVSD